MRVKRKPILYDAQPGLLGNWEVTNLFTKEKKLMNDKEFRAQFERVEDIETVPKKKYEQKNYAPLDHELVDPNDGSKGIRLRHIAEDL